MNLRTLHPAPLLSILILVFTLIPVDAQAATDPSKTPHGAAAGKAAQDGDLRGSVVEVFDSGGYTYARLDTGEKEVWAAGPITPLEVGSRVVLETSMPMRDFHSKALDRDFDLIYFVSGFQTEEEEYDQVLSTAHADPGKRKAGAAPKPVEVVPLEDGATIGTVRGARQEFAGKTVRIRGEVSKFTPQVMGKNWVHIRDASTDQDLTVTTQDEVAVGDVVVVEGVLSMDRDFGYGYVYDVLIEDGSVTAQK